MLLITPFMAPDPTFSSAALGMNFIHPGTSSDTCRSEDDQAVHHGQLIYTYLRTAGWPKLPYAELHMQSCKEQFFLAAVLL